MRHFARSSIIRPTIEHTVNSLRGGGKGSLHLSIMTEEPPLCVTSCRSGRRVDSNKRTLTDTREKGGIEECGKEGFCFQRVSLTQQVFAIAIARVS